MPGFCKEQSFTEHGGGDFRLFRLVSDKKGKSFSAISVTIRQKGILRPDLIGELQVQNLTNLTRPSCACVRGGKNEVKITCTHAPGGMIKQYSFIDTNRTQSDTLNNRSG